MRNLVVIEISAGGGRKLTGCCHDMKNGHAEARKIMGRLGISCKFGYKVKLTEYAFVGVDVNRLNFGHMAPVRVSGVSS